jgi:SulP family sulfate permease
VLGLNFLYTWVIEAYRRFPRIDYAILIVILLVIAAVGYMPGVAAGLAAVLVMFVINYSRIDVVRSIQTGESYRSRVTRPQSQQQSLSRSGERLLMLRLQGFLFFGTANSLLLRLRNRLQQPASQVSFILLDFQQVTGMDSTALLSFLKLEQISGKLGAYLLIAGASPAVCQSLTLGGFGSASERVQFFPAVDYALEWYEERVLSSGEEAPAAAGLRQVILDLAQTNQAPPALVDSLLDCMERLELPAGHVLIRQGDSPEDLYFLETGQMTAQYTRQDGQSVRLQTMLGGQVIGELGFYLGVERTADVVTEAPSVVYRLSRRALQHLEKSHPESAALLHRLIIRLLSERVTHLMRVVDALQ